MREKELEDKIALLKKDRLYCVGLIAELRAKLNKVISEDEIVKGILKEFNGIGEDVTYNASGKLLLLDGGLLCYQGKDGIVFNTDIIPNKALSLIETFFMGVK